MAGTNVLYGFEGLYLVREAAIYLTASLKRDLPEPVQVYHVGSRQLLHWVRAGLTFPALASVSGNQLVITFEDLISMRVIATMRALGLTWPKIHKAEQWLREQTGYPRPFAIYRVWTETVDVFAEIPIGLAAASRHGQLAFPELLAQYLQPIEDMSFVPHNGISVADTWAPHASVLIDPQVQFGEPCVQGTRTPTRMLWRMWSGGDSLSYLSCAFKLSDSQVTHALEWEDRLRAAEDHTVSC